ncbi:MAG: hypothetical protein ISR77_34745 [Pirellulaceae bacterium]|nr:hypothetical protein [Pirellulaceae bacterium]
MKFAATVVWFGLIGTAAWIHQTAPAAENAPDSPVVVLDTSGFWRLHYTLRKPVFQTDDGDEVSAVGYRTPLPPVDWASATFDDSSWRRMPGAPLPPIHSSWAPTFIENAGFIHTHIGSPSLAVLSARGKFSVTDPTAVKGLKLNVEYRGGVTVQVNGQQIVFGHLPAGAGPEVLAHDYPLEAFLDAGAKLLEADRGEKDPENLRRWALRTRRLTGIEVPLNVLRRGVNVLALQVHRAPYPKPAIDKLRKSLNDRRRWPHHLWSTCGLRHVRLIADGAEGIVANVRRPEGLQAWNSAPLASDQDLDWGDPNEPLRPVVIAGTRNGAFSGKVVVGNTVAITGLQAEMSELRPSRGGRAISASAVQVRYAALLGAIREIGSESHYRVEPSRFDALLEQPPAVIPVREKEPTRDSRTLARPGQPEENFGAVQPIWITVHVPPDAAPGDYAGTLTITLDGHSPIEVPVQLSVADFQLPDRSRYRTFVDLVHSPESLALRYDTPLYGDEHFELIAKAQRLLSQVGNKTAYVHLICQTNMGNEQSLVRWIPRAGGRYTHDFSAFDKYLDTVVNNMGKPEIISLYLFDYHLAKRRGVPVTQVDPATGRLETILLPPFERPEAIKLWQPVADHIRNRLREHDLEGAIMLGLVADVEPPPGVLKATAQLFPSVPWMRHAHSLRRSRPEFPLGYQAIVWSARWPGKPSDGSRLGWSREDRVVQFMRYGESAPPTFARLLGEMNLIGEQRGFGRIGADFWPVLKGDRRSDLMGRYPDSGWRNLEWMTRYMLLPGPAGPVSSARMEMMREGIQECEARIFVEQALTEEKITGALAQRCRQVLEHRLWATMIGVDNHSTSGLVEMEGHGWWSTPGQVGYHWYLGSDWQDRSEQLYQLAADVAKALGTSP